MVRRGLLPESGARAPKCFVGFAPLWAILSGYLPHAVIADRTALEGVPVKDGSVFLISQGTLSDVDLPGLGT